MKGRVRLLLGIALFFAGLAVLLTLFGFRYFPVQADETTLAWAAKRVAMGQVPYGDFFCFIPPLTLYGLAAFFKAFGASLGALRMLTIVWLALVTLLLYGLFRRPGLKEGWSFAAAVQFPALLVTFWPVPSHHWFALGLGLAALFMALRAGSVGGTLSWVLAAFLAALSGLCLQTEGALFTLLVLLVFLLTARDGTFRRKALWSAAAFAAPLGLMALFLAVQGAFGWAWYDLVTWPAAYYKLPGGFNDVKPFAFIGNLLADRFPTSLSLHAIAPFVNLVLALSLPLLCLLLLAFSPAWLERDGGDRKTWSWTFAGALVTLALFLKGRPDWTHLIFFTPILFVLCFQEVDFSKERLRPALLKTWLGVALAVAVLHWPLYWVKAPPLVTHVLETDAYFAQAGPPGILRSLPELRLRRAAILYLPHGSSLYFDWAPVPPPLDWVMPPSSRSDAPWEYQTLADFTSLHEIPYILIAPGYVRAFTEEPSDLSNLIRTHYRFDRNTPWGTLFERMPDEPAAPR
jgi:hypothetical protein